MNRLKFTDRRGDEYTFILYSTNEVKATKRRGVGPMFHQIDFSAEAIERLRELLDSEG